MERIIVPPELFVEEPARRRVSAPGLTHLMRGLTFLSSARPSAAIPHLRLALMYDHDSAFIHERLSFAWGASGERNRAKQLIDAGLAKNPQAPGLNRLAGHLALQARDYEHAVEYLGIATESDDEAAVAGPMLVAAQLWRSETDAAERLALDLLERMPLDLTVALRVAGILEEHGRLEAALHAYEHAQDQHPSERTAATGRARVLDLMGRAHDAVDGLISLFRFYPDAPELFVEITRLLRRLGSADADTYRREAVRYTRDDPRGRIMVAAGDLLEGREDLGLALLRQTVVLFPAYPGARLYLAEVTARRSDTAGCLQALSLPAGARTDDPYHRARFGCYAASGRASEAIHELNMAAAAGEAPRELLFALASHLPEEVGEQRVRRELAALTERFAEQLPASDVALAQALLDDRFGNGARALELVRGVHSSDPKDVRATLRLADLEARYGDVAQALEMLDELVREEPYNAVRLNALGFTLADEQQRLEEAAVWLRRAYRLSPEDGFIVDSLGWLLFRQGRYAEALRLLQRASRASVGDPEILRHLGDTHRALGRHTDARKSYSAALSASPTAALRRLIEERLAEYSVSPESS